MRRTGSAKTLEDSWAYAVEQTRHFASGLKVNENAPSVSNLLQSSHSNYFSVPKEPSNNLQYRLAIIEEADKDKDFRIDLWTACRHDILFWVNTFGWLFEPRIPAKLPFVTYPFQDRSFITMMRDIGKKDIGVEKSRDMGFTWIAIYLFAHQFIFEEMRAFGLVSRTEDLVDKSEDPDCLMWKFDFIFEHLPTWMCPPIDRKKLTIKNARNGSSILGYAATGDVARGGRKTAFLKDEMAAWRIDDSYACAASTQSVSDCRVILSTPQGRVGYFAETMANPNAEITKISAHWSQHPDKRRGLYQYEKATEEIKFLDDKYEYPEGYQFVRDGKVRSPWYDRECRRHPIPSKIAQELDIDYGGSGAPFFAASTVESHITDHACPPTKKGNLDFSRDDYEGEWVDHDDGEIELWINLNIHNQPEGRYRYGIGCDIATGAGGEYSTASTASVVNLDTGEKVAAMVCATTEPHAFAEKVYSLRKFFEGPQGIAFLIWEVNGPGGLFTKWIMKLCPQRVFFRRSESTVTKKRTDKPGWHSGKDEKLLLLGEYTRAIERRTFINHCQHALKECFDYVYTETGSVIHNRSKSTHDPSSAGENHGDRVIADALASRLVKDPSARKAEEEKPKEAPYGSMAWRMQLAEDDKKKDPWL